MARLDKIELKYLSKQARRPKRLRGRKPPDLTAAQILAWADEHHQRTGKWPMTNSGRIRPAAAGTWAAVDLCLRQGRRGLPGGSSLARLLARERGVRNVHGLPALTEKQIVVWADAHHQRTGRWPKKESGPIHSSAGDTWLAVDACLRRALRGLPGGSSLSRLLARERGVRNHLAQPRLTIGRILAWADAHHKRTGRWPVVKSGPIPESSGEIWNQINQALGVGRRGLRGGESLAQLLHRKRGARNHRQLPLFTKKRILLWADDYFRRHGKWPRAHSGAVPAARGETWRAISHALRRGTRGLKGGSSLAQLLAAARGVRNEAALPPFTKAQILVWADAYRRATGKWPKSDSPPIGLPAGETWSAVNTALSHGTRGLPGGCSMVRLLAAKRGLQPHHQGRNRRLKAISARKIRRPTRSTTPASR